MLFCGDGINDLSALSAADVGYAVGATEASVAASVYTTHRSVAGMFCWNSLSTGLALEGISQHVRMDASLMYVHCILFTCYIVVEQLCCQVLLSTDSIDCVHSRAQSAMQ